MLVKKMLNLSLISKFSTVHSLSLHLLLLFKDLVGLQCHLFLVHQLLPVQLPASLHGQTLFVRHEQLAALRV